MQYAGGSRGPEGSRGGSRGPGGSHRETQPACQELWILSAPRPGPWDGARGGPPGSEWVLGPSPRPVTGGSRVREPSIVYAVGVAISYIQAQRTAYGYGRPCSYIPT